MNVTSVQVDDEVPRVAVSAASSRRLSSATLENVTSPVTATISGGIAHAPVRATRGGALHVRCPSARAHWSTRYSPQPPGPSGASTGRSGSSKPGPVVEHAEVHDVVREPQLDLDRALRRRRCGGRRWRPARWPAAAGPGPCAGRARRRPAPARRRRRGRRAVVAGKRSDTTRGGVTCSARQAMSSRGVPAAISTAVRFEVLDHGARARRPRARRPAPPARARTAAAAARRPR